jgi:hypothetical protein
MSIAEVFDSPAARSPLVPPRPSPASQSMSTLGPRIVVIGCETALLPRRRR